MLIAMAPAFYLQQLLVNHPLKIFFILFKNLFIPFFLLQS